MHVDKIGIEMSRQNNRGTQGVMFMIQTERERVGNPDYDDIDHTAYKICEEHATDELHEHADEPYEEDEVNDDVRGCYSCEKLPIVVFHEDTTGMTGLFFTEKAAQRHIDENHYHYKNPRIYGVATWRNPEMVAVQQHLLELADKKIPSHYL